LGICFLDSFLCNSALIFIIPSKFAKIPLKQFTPSRLRPYILTITNDVWIAVAGLKFYGIRINRGNLGVVEDFNKIQFYKSCLKDPYSKVRNFLIGGLKLDERLIAFIVSWIITPRGGNHFTLSEEDLLMIYFIMNKVKIN